MDEIQADNSRKIKKEPGKLKRFIGKTADGIKRVTEGPRRFMQAGRAGGMIASVVLSTQFMYWIVKGMADIPAAVCVLLTPLLIILLTELSALLLKLLFGGVKRSRVYYVVAVGVVCANNTIGTQGQDILPAVIMSMALALACDIMGRCIWGFIKSRRFKQVFAYIVMLLSLAYMGIYGYFFRSDSFGEDRVDFYYSIEPAADSYVADIVPAEGFEDYLKDGDAAVCSLSYGPGENEDIVTGTYDISGYDSVLNRNPMDKLTGFFSKYDFAEAPIKGQIWYPGGMSGCPVLFFVHGNHDAATPSYLGYDYLGEYLASNGYVVVSVDENIINDLHEGNDKRAILLLENMKAILEENEREGSPIYGLIDPDRIVIGGHSRGGEMVADAYLFNGLERYPEDGNYRFDHHFNISGIIAVAPVVDQYMPVSQAVQIKDTNYLLLHGSNDQDVSSMMGEKQYNNLYFTGDGDEQYIKSSVYILGANHGQFNSLWGRYDGEGAMNGYLNTCNFIDEAEQKLIAKAYIRVFLDKVLKQDDTYASLLSDIGPYRSFLPRTVYITDHYDSGYTQLCSFDDTFDIAHPSDKVSLWCSGISTWNIQPYERGRGGEGEDHVLSCAFNDESEPAVELTFAPIDISDGCISFGLADMREDTHDMHSPLEYSVELADQNGERISVSSPVMVYHSLAVQLYKQDVLFDEYEYKHQLQTVDITPQMFESGGFDFTKVVSLKITTNGRKKGRIIINEIAYKK